MTDRSNASRTTVEAKTKRCASAARPTRRGFGARLLGLALSAAATLGLAPAPAMAQAAQPKLKVAAIYTVPYEQQWVSRIHKALKAAEARGEIEYKSSESVANADYERVMREYATGGSQLIVGEVFGVEAAARKVARDFPKVAFLAGSSGKPQAPNFSVFDNYIQETLLPHGHDRRRHDQDEQDTAWSAAFRSPKSTA